jgi:hypothetical protein
MYRVIKTTYFGVEQTSIIRDNGNEQYTSFPADENNPNYQAYLAWVAQGNTPEPADKGTQ